MGRWVPGDHPAFEDTTVISFMKYIHPRGPKLINYHSGEGLPDLRLQFSKGNTQQSQILSDGDSMTFMCARLPPQASGLGRHQPQLCSAKLGLGTAQLVLHKTARLSFFF